MLIVGYADRLAVAPGEVVSFHVSTTAPTYTAELVKPSHDREQTTTIVADISGTYDGEEQRFPLGSHVTVDQPVPLPRRGRLGAWILPTSATPRRQGILTWGEHAGLFIGAEGDLEFCWGDNVVRSGAPLQRGEWCRVTCELDEDRIVVSQFPRRGASAVGDGRMDSRTQDHPFRIGYAFDGKIDAPFIEGVAAWDFSIDVCSTRVVDTGPHAYHGRTVNMPVRAVTGWNWTGRSVDFKRTPGEYGAIHFHRDDMDDACWRKAFSFRVPDDLSSALYAVRLRAADSEYFVPFFVRPPRRRATSRIAFLAPTFTYLAYSCFPPKRFRETSPEEALDMEKLLRPEDHYSRANSLLSAYDLHADGSGNCHVTYLRPLPNMTPYYTVAAIGGPAALGADLHILDWLTMSGFDHHVITDHDLHQEGAALVEPYRVVITGTHPEYWSAEMLDAAETYLEGGGRFMYLGGNGMYWVTSVHHESPHVLEIRRGYTGTRPWQSAPGEAYHAATGEPGGLWRLRGRTPQRHFLVGTTAAGYGRGRPYQRTAASYDEAVTWIFDGVKEDEFGSYGAVQDAAGSFELDRVDAALGTPPETVTLAIADGFDDRYRAAIEESLMHAGDSGGSNNPRVRADLAYVEYPNGSAVFATGSIGWGTSLTWMGGDNDVSRITANVLRRFSGDMHAGDSVGA